jgi:16S rRNA (cytidine1402-2'-O)-methyltransferase
MGPGASHSRHDDLTALAGLAEQDLPVRALYVVALPIGNAADITLRALWILARVDAIAAEDTRVTGPLLARFGIATPVLAAHQHNERTVAAAIVERLQKGQRVALVSDAGTPGVSDPGAVIVRTVLEADLRVIPIPGASSALAAVSAAGLRAGGFHFIGFLPAGARERERVLRTIASSDEAAVLFEAPHRIHALQGELSHILPPDRRVVIARELTKKFETIRVHPASALADLEPEERGEYVIVIDTAEHADHVDHAALDPQGQRWLDALLEELTPARAAAIVSRMTGVPRSVVYDEAIRRRRAPTQD